MGAFRRAVSVFAVAAATAVALADAPPTNAKTSVDRFALATGCWRLEGGGVRSKPLRFQPVTLGRYLLVDRRGRFISARRDDTVAAEQPSKNAEWDASTGEGWLRLRASAKGTSFRLGGSSRLSAAAADGCFTLPDIGTGVTGPHAIGASPTGEVRGFLDAHLHITGYESLGGMVHCGRPWHPYGVANALTDCADHVPGNGAAAVFENFLLSGSPVGRHDPVGWPTFADWPAPLSLTHEQVYFRWLERAWRGGLRLVVNLAVENRVLCEAYPLKRNACDEMQSVRRQVRQTRELERYIDALSGGPGRGWFRIVTDPATARATINEGKLAVVLGMEVSEPFGCRELAGLAQCDRAAISHGLIELRALGVRHVFVVHKFDNAIGGTTGDPGATGPVINIGNALSTGHLMNMESCDANHTGAHDREQELPIYPDGPHCNKRGLTSLGRQAVSLMIDRRMIIDVDHMSVRARRDALDVIEHARYAGVVSGHSWATPDAEPRVLAAGGVVTPYAGNARDFFANWRRVRTLPGFFGIGYGADANGLGTQGTPDGGSGQVRYPFTGFGGTTIDRQVSGERVFDVNRDGVAHYGLYPDWIEDLRKLAGDAIVDDLARGPEAYLRMWERAAAL